MTAVEGTTPLGNFATPRGGLANSMTMTSCSTGLSAAASFFMAQYYAVFDVLNRPDAAFSTEPLTEAQQQFYDACCHQPKELLLQHMARFHEAATLSFTPITIEKTGAIQSLALSYQSSDATPAHADFAEFDRVLKSFDEDGSKVVNGHVVLRELGRGSSGKVKLTFNTKTNKLNALKVIPREKPVKLSAQPVIPNSRREVSLQKRLEHPNIVKLYEVIDDPDCPKIYLVMQYVDGGHLGQRADTAPPNDADTRYAPVDPSLLAEYARGMLSAVAYLHKNGVVHRDIKPENILVSEDRVAYVADLGVAENFYNTDSRSIHGRKGTLLFMSPSLLAEQAVSDGYANDMWAVGVTLYAALTGRLPFACVDDILKSHETLQLPTDFGPSWHKLLQRLLCVDPERRWTAARALRFTRHELYDQRYNSAFGALSESVRSESRLRDIDSSGCNSSWSTPCKARIPVTANSRDRAPSYVSEVPTELVPRTPVPPEEERDALFTRRVHAGVEEEDPIN